VIWPSCGADSPLNIPLIPHPKRPTVPPI
jgi:hypothetical protein